MEAAWEGDESVYLASFFLISLLHPSAERIFVALGLAFLVFVLVCFFFISGYILFVLFLSFN